MYRLDPRRLRFTHWATPVRHRGWAALSVILHRLQRLTVHTPWLGHRAIRTAECAAFGRATTLA